LDVEQEYFQIKDGRPEFVMNTQARIALSAILLAVANVAFSESAFTRITEGALVEDTGHFLGADWGDYDNDGFLDVIVANTSPGMNNHLYHNNGDGTFSRVTEGTLATDGISPRGPNWADYDNDGDLDLFVSTNDQPDPGNAFYRNEGEGVFVKVTEGAWVNTPGMSESSTWGDYDNDGFIDLYVANDGDLNFLYHNCGDGTMEPVKTETNWLSGSSHGCLWSDFDNDGDVDLFTGGQAHIQYRNDGDGVFTWISPKTGGIPKNWDVTDVAFASADYDNDGDLDMLYTSWDTSPANMLYRNDGAAGYVPVTDVLPPIRMMNGMGAAWGDYDNDGFLDLFIANHSGPNLLYHNEGEGRFTRIKNRPPVSKDFYSAACAWVDYDNDGDLDLFTTNGSFSGTEQSCELFRNDGGTNNWIMVNLVSTVSNRSAIGAKVRLQAVIEEAKVEQLREINGGGNGNSTSGTRVHFGLGDAWSVDSICIEWPSGIVQKVKNISPNQVLTIKEDMDTWAGRENMMRLSENSPELITQGH